MPEAEAIMCPTCTEAATLLCSRCKEIKYCSTECRETDWPAHRLLCDSAKAFTEAPSKNLRRVILFSDKKDKPEFLWMPIHDVLDEDGNFEYQTVRMLDTMGTEFPDFEIIQENKITLIPSNHLIQLHFTDKDLEENDGINMSVYNATSGMAESIWGGPLLAICGVVDESGEDIFEVKDMDMRAYSDVIAFLIDYKNDTVQHAALKGPKVEAVEILCDGKCMAEGKRFETVSIPRYHPLVRSEAGITCPISCQIGLSLGMIKCDTKSKKADPTNRIVALMQSSCDLDETVDVDAGKQGFGWPSTDWDLECGSVMVLREDLKPLSVDTVEAYSLFCCKVVSMMRQTEQGSESSVKISSPSETVAEITADKWAAFFNQWQEDRAAVGNNVHGDVSGEVGELITAFGLVQVREEKAASSLQSAITEGE